MQYRDCVLAGGALPALVHLASRGIESDDASVLRNVARALCSLCSMKPYPALPLVCAALPVLSALVCVGDMQTVVEAVWALSCISDGSKDRVQAVIDAGVGPRLVQLLTDPQTVEPALATLGEKWCGCSNYEM